MNPVTFEKIDEMERQVKSTLEDLISSQKRDADSLRKLLATLAVLRGSLVAHAVPQ